ncbi:sugar efflux transporter [Vibrio mexicanus]|uniref:sugar efflux transporter n=1 Tax=Vibrio mexicanus TaxID=1004326 RepID=UPI00063C60EF|nr:sugar efflux transporter [Vibrio mexicanus]
MFKDKTALLFVCISFICGLCGAFFYPLSSLFIVQELGASPMMLSVYMVAAVGSSVAVSHFIAKQSDKNWNRKTILVVSLTSYFVTVTSFIFIRDYWTAVALVVIFGSVSGAAFGQLFALGREYGDRYVNNSASFLAVMRAGLAIAWVFGPPIAFMLNAKFGFSAAFAVSSVTVLAGILLVMKFVPSQVVTKKEKSEASEVSKPLGARVILYCVILVCAFGANNLYITSMPLYLSQELMVNPSWLGLLFGMAAACEIPVMLTAGPLANRLGAVKLMILGALSGVMFFLVMLSQTSFIAMLFAQVFNGFFIGVWATIGMVALQDMMKDRLGTASTLFSNMLSVSTLVSSLAVGVIGEMYNYYSALYVSLAGLILSLALLVLFQIKSKPICTMPTRAAQS